MVSRSLCLNGAVALAAAGKQGTDMVSHRLPRRFIDDRIGARSITAVNSLNVDSVVVPISGTGDGARRLSAAGTGFRHFLETLEPTSSFDASVLTPGLQAGDMKFPNSLGRYKRRIGRLALAMSAYRYNSLDGQRPGAHDNPCIPAGYTYLLQLIAHDLVASSIPLSNDQSELLSTRNTRSLPLRLETLYGAGPELLQLCYQREQSPEMPRRYLRMGSAFVEGGGVVLRDIPRRCIFPLDRAAMANPTLYMQAREAQLADSRNDDNGIISQLLTVFIMLHNAVLDVISAKLPETVKTETPPQLLAVRTFEAARAIVTLVYRRIIREDLLGRILHPDIHKLYGTAQNAIVDQAAAAGDIRPVKEFSLGAFRFGHAMMRENYHFRPDALHHLPEILEQSSGSLRQTVIPPNISWLISWSRFFDIDSAAPAQPSRKIQPGTDLTQLVLGARNNVSLGRDIEGLEYADMLSGGLARLWRLDPLIDALAAHQDLNALIARSSLLASPDKRRFAIENWLQSFVPKAKPGDTDREGDIQALVAEPPLTFFVRFEAGWPGLGGGNGGTHLGILGSILVAESFYSALSGSRMGEEASTNPVAEAVRGRLGAKAASALAADLITPLSRVKSMPDLLRQVQLLAKPPGPDFL